MKAIVYSTSESSNLSQTMLLLLILGMSIAPSVLELVYIYRQTILANPPSADVAYCSKKVLLPVKLIPVSQVK